MVTLPTGTYDELSILATAHNGDVQKEATLAYNDGSTVQVPLRFTDWAVTPKFGEEIAIDMPYRHNGGGDTSPRVMIFTQRIPLEAGKQPDTLTLPADPKLHVFAVSGVRGEEPPRRASSPSAPTSSTTPSCSTTATGRCAAPTRRRTTSPAVRCT